MTKTLKHFYLVTTLVVLCLLTTFATFAPKVSAQTQQDRPIVEILRILAEGLSQQAQQQQFQQQRYHVRNETNDDIVVCFYRADNKKTLGWYRLKSGESVNIPSGETWVHMQRVPRSAPNDLTKVNLGYSWDHSKEPNKRTQNLLGRGPLDGLESRFYWVHVREHFNITGDYGVTNADQVANMTPPSGASFRTRPNGNGVPMPMTSNSNRAEHGWRPAKFYKAVGDMTFRD